MSMEAGNTFKTAEQAWAVVELGLKNYPEVDADRGQRMGALRNIAEGLRQYWLLNGDRQAIVDEMGQMELPVTLLGDTDLALSELGWRYLDNGNRLEEGDWSFFEGVVSLREVIEAGKADDPGVSQEFRDRTQNAKGWLAGERMGRAGEVMRRVEEGAADVTRAVATRPARSLPVRNLLTEELDRIGSPRSLLERAIEILQAPQSYAADGNLKSELTPLLQGVGFMKIAEACFAEELADDEETLSKVAFLDRIIAREQIKIGITDKLGLGGWLVGECEEELKRLGENFTAADYVKIPEARRVELLPRLAVFETRFAHLLVNQDHLKTVRSMRLFLTGGGWNI